MTDEKTNKERLDSINTKLDNIISSLENKVGVTQPTTLKGLLDATKSTHYLFQNYKGESIDGLIAYNDTSNVTDMSSTFIGCSNMKTIPLLNTSKVTNMNSMFRDCSHLESVPEMDTSNVTNMSQMFYTCYRLKELPLLDTSKVTNFSFIVDASTVYDGNVVLTTIPAWNVSNGQNLSGMFGNCKSLTEIHMYGMKVNFSISSSTKFTREALVEILNNLATVTSSKILTLGTTNLEKLTEEDKAIATAKGWTLA